MRSRIGRWLLKGQPQEMEGPYETARPHHQHSWWQVKSREGRRVSDDFRYSSETNTEWLTIPELRALIDEHEPARLAA